MGDVKGAFALHEKLPPGEIRESIEKAYRTSNISLLLALDEAINV
jgi:hypothetical protein